MSEGRYQQILAEDDGTVAVLTINRPERMNAWTWRVGRELQHAIAHYDARDEIRAIVVTGAGRAFCAGADLGAGGDTFQGGGSATGSRADAADELALPHDKRPFELGTPIIAAMNGPAVGVGMTMAMEYDIRIAAQDARYGFVFNRRGVVPEVNSQWLVPRLIGLSRGLELLLTGRLFRGEDGAAWGLFSAAHPAADVLDAALDVARDIAVNVAPVSAAIVKRNVYLGAAEPDPEEAHGRENQLFGWTAQQADAREGPMAFIEKRDPDWKLRKHTDFPEHLFE
jgi:enoyl-CoA hydratase/carnithine racemase